MNLTPDYIAWAGIGAVLSAVVSIIATIAASRAAGAARRATDLAIIQQRETSVRAVYRDAHRVAVMATRVGSDRRDHEYRNTDDAERRGAAW